MSSLHTILSSLTAEVRLRELEIRTQRKISALIKMTMWTCLLVATVSASLLEIVTAAYCGPVYYDPTTHFCLDNKVGKYCDRLYPETYSPRVYRCCGTLKYKILTHHCQNGQIYRLGDSGTKCQGVTYDSSTHFCQYNKVAPYCNPAYKAIYDPRSHACCDLIAYNIFTHECVDGQVYLKH